MKPFNEQADNLLDLYFPVLDYGFVRLCDYMGTDKCVEEAARVSYQQGTRQVSKTKGLLRYLRSHRHCYDSETEVLTNRGFIKWPNVTKQDLLGIWDPDMESLCYEKPEYLIKTKYIGEMYKVTHSKIDLLVTPEHKMYVDTRKWCPIRKSMFWAKNQRLIEAKKLNHSSTIRYFKTAPKLVIENDVFKHKFFSISKNTAALLKLIGFFIGDGYAGGTFANGVMFHLKKTRKIDYLKRICKENSFELKENANNNSFYVYGAGFRDLFRDNFYNDEGKKVIPKFLMNLNQEYALHLIDGLINSDGSKKRNTFTYSSNSEKLMEAMQIIALHAGYSAHINKPQRGIYRMSFLTHPDAVINQGVKNTDWVNYNGHVYCAKTRTGILVVRRNGKIVLSGNSSPFEMIELKFHISMPIFCMRQFVRHRTASLNEVSGRYSLLPMIFYTPQKEHFCKQSSSNNQGRSVEEFDSETYNKSINDWNILRDKNKDLYKSLTDQDLARELARIDLPLSTYTQFYWKANLHNIFHMLKLRADSHAQYEIRAFANVMAGIVKIVAPLSYEAWIDYDFESISFSRLERKALIEYIAAIKDNKELSDDELVQIGLSKREVKDFRDKLLYNEISDFNLDISSAKDYMFFENIAKKFSIDV